MVGQAEVSCCGFAGGRGKYLRQLITHLPSSPTYRKAGLEVAADKGNAGEVEEFFCLILHVNG